MDIANLAAVAKLEARRSRLLELLDVAENGRPVISLEVLETKWRAEGSREVKPGSDLPAEALQNAIICLAQDGLVRVNSDLAKFGVQTPAVKTYSDSGAVDASDIVQLRRSLQGWVQFGVMLLRGWQREIGPHRRNWHLVDEFVGSISDLRKRADALAPLVDAAQKYRDTICLVNNAKPEEAMAGSPLAVLDAQLTAARRTLP